MWTPILDQVVRIFGLPAHPLIVHAAVVLIPLAGITFVLTGWKESWRRIYYLPITLLALGGAVAAFLATETGESLEDAVKAAGRRVGDHPEEGSTAMIFAMVFAIGCVVALLVNILGPEWRRRTGFHARLPVSDNVAMYVLVSPLAIIAILSMVVAGHSGASLAWNTIR